MKEIKEIASIFSDRLVQQSPNFSLQIALSQAERIRNLLNDLSENIFAVFSEPDRKKSVSNSNWYYEDGNYVWDGNRYDSAISEGAEPDIEIITFKSITLNVGKAIIRRIIPEIVVENPDNKNVDVSVELVKSENPYILKRLPENTWIYEEVERSIKVGVLIKPDTNNSNVKVLVKQITILYSLL